MQIEYRRRFSSALGRDMEYKVYGHRGKPVLVFPTSEGRFYQWEDFGMIDALDDFIEQGKVQLWTVDGIDSETFFSTSWDRQAAMRRQESYFAYLDQELVPSILGESRDANGGTPQELLVTGASMGAFHAANFFFRFPWNIDTVVGLSGVYSTRYFFGEDRPVEIYLNSPTDYLPNNSDPAYLDKFRASRLIFCCGQGAWEDEMIEETRVLERVLAEKGIPAWVDFWGTDVNHDWDWWRTQIVYFFGKVFS
ncbi:MAG: hypothetical protein LBN10_04310 [Propionibacteriaceae bacterium]|jgi:esterase/lipase superfamily enzyme|nr:hypothetical protein [Propionibacteriaceae bacterium]